MLDFLTREWNIFSSIDIQTKTEKSWTDYYFSRKNPPQLPSRFRLNVSSSFLQLKSLSNSPPSSFISFLFSFFKVFMIRKKLESYLFFFYSFNSIFFSSSTFSFLLNRIFFFFFVQSAITCYWKGNFFFSLFCFWDNFQSRFLRKTIHNFKFIYYFYCYFKFHRIATHFCSS